MRIRRGDRDTGFRHSTTRLIATLEPTVRSMRRAAAHRRSRGLCLAVLPVEFPRHRRGEKNTDKGVQIGVLDFAEGMTSGVPVEQGRNTTA